MMVTLNTFPQFAFLNSSFQQKSLFNVLPKLLSRANIICGSTVTGWSSLGFKKYFL